MTRHLDLTAGAGETLDVGVRFYVPAAPVLLATVVPGSFVFFRGDPWPVHSVEVLASGSVRVRLGRGQFFEPDIASAPDALAVPAVPATFDQASVVYRRNDGTWGGLPFGLAASSTELRVLPHDAASSSFTAALAAEAEANGGPVSFDWQATATFTDAPGVRRLVEGALAIIPALPAGPPAPVPAGGLHVR